MSLTSPAVLSVRMSQKLEYYNSHSLNLESSAVTITDLAACGRMETGVLLRWQQLFQSALASFREERKVLLSFVLFYTDSENYFLGELS